MPSTAKDQRNQMVSKVVERVRMLEKDKGVTREALQDIKVFPASPNIREAR